MRFKRYPPNIEEFATPQRVRAAERNVAAQREKFALFPEMMEDTSAAERVAKILIARRDGHQERRDEVAANWRRARRELATLPKLTQEGVRAYWQRCSLPGSHEYLATIITEAKRGISFWHKLAESRRYWLISRGRLPNPWVQKAPILPRNDSTLD